MVLKTTYDTFDNGNLAVIMLNKEDGDLFADLTVNIDKLPEGYAAIDTNNCPWAEKFIADNGLGTPTGKKLRAGFYEYPVYQMRDDLLREGVFS